MYYFVGLGNPDDQYKKTRHNVGRNLVEKFAEKNSLSDFRDDKKTQSLVSQGEVAGEKVLAILPNAYMNKSGLAAASLKGKKKSLEKLIVVHDDLDLPLGTVKMSFAKNSGGHRGVESIIKTVKSNEFVRLRIGISKADKKGRAKKPVGEDKVVKHVLSDFKKDEEALYKKVEKKVFGALELILELGYKNAMNEVNRG